MPKQDKQRSFDRFRTQAINVSKMLNLSGGICCGGGDPPPDDPPPAYSIDTKEIKPNGS